VGKNGINQLNNRFNGFKGIIMFHFQMYILIKTNFKTIEMINDGYLIISFSTTEVVDF